MIARFPFSAALAAAVLSACSSCPFAACDDKEDGPAGARAAASVHSFDDAPAGALPGGWRTGATKPSGPPATWQVVADPSAPSGPHALAMTAHQNEAIATFNLCWNDSLRFHDGSLRVRVRALAGEDDQGGGPMWRVRDADHYYICRWNPLETNFRLYSVVGGARKQLAGATVELDADAWHEIRVEQVGDHIRCWIGDVVIEARDSALPDEGAVGLWTKADALTAFDDLRVEAGPSGR